MEEALNVLEGADRSLVIVWKGMAWYRAEEDFHFFLERKKLPFLASSLGMGVLDDRQLLSVVVACSYVLKEAGEIFLMGARLTWIMNFENSPCFNKDVRVILTRYGTRSIW